MIRTVTKDLRELFSSPVGLLGVFVWAAAVLWITSLLPLPSPRIDIAIVTPELCDETYDDDCPQPNVTLLEHAITDLPNTKYHGRLDNRPGRFERLYRDDLDIIFVWHETYLTAEEMIMEPDWADFDDLEAGGLWLAYTSPRTRAETAQVQFAIRQVQLTALHIDNARRRGADPVLPSIGVADVFGEFATVALAAEQQAAADAVYDAEDRRRDAVTSALDDAIAEFETEFGRALSAAEAQRIRSIFRRQQRSWNSASRLLFAEALREALNDDNPSEPESYSEAAAVHFTRALDAADDADLEDNNVARRATPFLVIEQDGPARTQSSWLIPGLILIIAAAISFTYTASFVVREREHGTEHLIYVASSDLRINPFLLKPFVPVFLALVTTLGLLLFCQAALGFQVKPGLGGALILLFLTCLTAAFQGLIAGSLVQNQATAAAISAAYLVSLLLFGNVFIPIEVNGWMAEFAANVLPVATTSDAWINWMTWGASFRVTDILVSLMMLFLSATAAYGAVLYRRSRI